MEPRMIVFLDPQEVVQQQQQQQQQSSEDRAMVGYKVCALTPGWQG
jgi:hypothetical protein